MIRVLIVEDSASAATLLRHVLESDPGLEVVDVARNGLEGVRMAALHKPDVVTMDIEMPVMDGFEATRRLMEETPTPVVVVSSFWKPEEVQKTFRAMQAGAVAIMRKPHGLGHPDFESSAKALTDTVKLMSEVKVVRRKTVKPFESKTAQEPKPQLREILRDHSLPTKLVVVGASTGGPPVLQRIFSTLRTDFALPILVVQHIATGFVGGLVDWLNSSSALPVKLATDGEVAEPGRIYFAPDGQHMGIEKNFRISLEASKPINGVRPAVCHLFRSAREAFGHSLTAVLLTGMGTDGASDMKLIKDAGGFTLAQDRESCVVFGMPGEAVRLGGVSRELPPASIVAALNALQGRRCGGQAPS